MQTNYATSAAGAIAACGTDAAAGRAGHTVLRAGGGFAQMGRKRRKIPRRASFSAAPCRPAPATLNTYVQQGRQA
jgi:hypothetical protein